MKIIKILVKNFINFFLIALKQDVSFRAVKNYGLPIKGHRLLQLLPSQKQP